LREPIQFDEGRVTTWLACIKALQKYLWVIQWGSPTSFDDGVIWMTFPMMNPARGIFSGIDSCVQWFVTVHGACWKLWFHRDSCDSLPTRKR